MKTKSGRQRIFFPTLDLRRRRMKKKTWRMIREEKEMESNGNTEDKQKAMEKRGNKEEQNWRKE